MRRPIDLDIDELVRMYYDECLSYQEIADLLHVSAPTIANKLNDAGYKRLSYGEKRASKSIKSQDGALDHKGEENLSYGENGRYRCPKKYDTLEHRSDVYRIVNISDGIVHLKLIEEQYGPVIHEREIDVSYHDLITGLTPYKLLDLPPVKVGKKMNGTIEWEENEKNDDSE